MALGYAVCAKRFDCHLKFLICTLLYIKLFHGGKKSFINANVHFQFSPHGSSCLWRTDIECEQFINKCCQFALYPNVSQNIRQGCFQIKNAGLVMWLPHNQAVNHAFWNTWICISNSLIHFPSRYLLPPSGEKAKKSQSGWDSPG